MGRTTENNTFMQLNNRYISITIFYEDCHEYTKKPHRYLSIYLQSLFHEGKLPKNIEGSIWEEI